jgi:hypothetical protein
MHAIAFAITAIAFCPRSGRLLCPAMPCAVIVKTTMPLWVWKMRHVVGSPIHASVGNGTSPRKLASSGTSRRAPTHPISSSAVKTNASGRRSCARSISAAAATHWATNPFMSAVPRP